MAYVTRAQIELRLGDTDRLEVLLADREGVERPGALDAAIADAQAEIDAAISARYAAPIAGTVPAQVSRWTADIALATLAENRPGGGGGSLAKKAERARGEIEMVRVGKLSISGLTPLDLVGGVAEAPPILTSKDRSVTGEPGTMDVM
jgi:phage gp36-like protein